MAQIFGDGDDIDAVGQQNRDQRMPEGVGVDVRKVVFGREIPEPTGYSSRPRASTVFAAENIAGIASAIAILQLPMLLLLTKRLK